jgi:hypothetical protein
MGVEFYGPQENPSAIVVRSDFSVDGIRFFSPTTFSQQLGLMTRPAGYTVPAHRHNLVDRNINSTQEVLILREGKCSVNLYSDENILEHTIELSKGDVILLAHGGHEIHMQTLCEILEVKQGPYADGHDKTHFTPEKN